MTEPKRIEPDYTFHKGILATPAKEMDSQGRLVNKQSKPKIQYKDGLPVIKKRARQRR